MGAGAEDRWRGALLTGLALAALSAGGWWWRAAAPATGPVAPAVSSPAPEEPLPSERFLVDAEDGYIIQSPERFLVDAEDGRVIQGPGIDPDEPLVLHQEPGATTPEASHVVWRDRSHLAEGDEPLVRQSAPSAGERQLLVVTCSGSGALTVAVVGTHSDGPGQRVPCFGSPTTVAVTSAGGPLLVRFTVSDGEVDLDARLVSLF